MTMKRLLTVLSLLAMTLAVAAQTVVSGVVTDRRTGHPLSHVNIYVGVATADSVPGGSAAESGSVHTVTNDDGRFTLKSGQRPQYVQLTHIGYRTLRHPLGDGPTEGLKLAMTASSVELEEVIVSNTIPLSNDPNKNKSKISAIGMEQTFANIIHDVYNYESISKDLIY